MRCRNDSGGEVWGVVHSVTLLAINMSHWVAKYVGANGSGTISAWFDNN